MKYIFLISALCISFSVSSQRIGKEVKRLDELFLSCFEKRDFQCCLESAQKLLEFDSTNARYMNNLAAVYSTLYQDSLALVWRERAYQYKRDTQQLFSIMRAEIDLEMFDACIRDCNAILEVEKGNLIVLNSRAYAYLMADRYELARTDLVYILKRTPDDITANINWIGILEHYYDSATAYNHLKKLYEKNPKDSGIILRVANRTMEDGLLDEAELLIEKALGFEWDNPDAYLLRAKLKLKRGNKKGALIDIRTAQTFHHYKLEYIRDLEAQCKE